MGKLVAPQTVAIGRGVETSGNERPKVHREMLHLGSLPVPGSRLLDPRLLLEGKRPGTVSALGARIGIEIRATVAERDATAIGETATTEVRAEMDVGTKTADALETTARSQMAGGRTLEPRIARRQSRPRAEAR